MTEGANMWAVKNQQVQLNPWVKGVHTHLESVCKYMHLAAQDKTALGVANGGLNQRKSYIA